MRRHFLRVAAAAASLAVTSCESTAEPRELAILQFRTTSIIGPCSANIAVRFILDGQLLGEEEFHIGGAPGGRLSAPFPVPAGSYVIRAQMTRWGGATLVNSDLWPDTTVTLVPRQLLVHTNDLYCS